jgi:hypothetical protein
MPLTTRRAGYAFAERGAGGGSSVDAKRGGICPARRSRVPVHESHERTTVKTARPTEASSRPYERKSSPSSHHRKAVRTQKLRKHGLGLSCFDADCLLEFCLGSLSLLLLLLHQQQKEFPPRSKNAGGKEVRRFFSKTSLNCRLHEPPSTL